MDSCREGLTIHAVGGLRSPPKCPQTSYVSLPDGYLINMYQSPKLHPVVLGPGGRLRFGPHPGPGKRELPQLVRGVMGSLCHHLCMDSVGDVEGTWGWGRRGQVK